MLHTELEKHLQGLSLEETLALAQLALKQAKKKAATSTNDVKKNGKKLIKTLKKHKVNFPKGFKFSREEANER